MDKSDYYVYVYIDPRNHEEFYYGKGRRNRKSAHLKDRGDSEKASRIQAITKAGLKPIIKVVAARLTEHEALLVEKTLIWKLGRTLANKASGHFKAKFRPHRTLHRDLAGFDYENDVYYVNVAEGDSRSWADCRRYGFLSAGGGRRWSNQIRRLEVGDVVAAYQKGAGYVGIGIVTAAAVPVSDFRKRGQYLSTLRLKEPGILRGAGNSEKCEYLAAVKWVRTVPRDNARFAKRSGLFTSQLVRASLSGQSTTLAFLKKHFHVSPIALLEKRSHRR